MGEQGIGEMNNYGELFADFQVNLIIEGIWVSPNHRTENEINHIVISKRWLLDSSEL